MNAQFHHFFSIKPIICSVISIIFIINRTQQLPTTLVPTIKNRPIKNRPINTT